MDSFLSSRAQQTRDRASLSDMISRAIEALFKTVLSAPCYSYCSFMMSEINLVAIVVLVNYTQLMLSCLLHCV